MLGAATFVGVSFNPDARFWMIGQVAGMGMQRGFVLCLDGGAVEIKIDAALGAQADRVHLDLRVDKDCLCTRGGGGVRLQFGGHWLAEQAGVDFQYATLWNVGAGGVSPFVVQAATIVVSTKVMARWMRIGGGYMRNAASYPRRSQE